MATRNLLVLVAACTAAGGLLVGCTAGGQSSMGADAGKAESMPGASAAAPERRGQSDGAAVSTDQLRGAQRKLVRTASFTVAAPDVEAAATKAQRIATDAGGYTAHARVSGDSATLELAVPSQKLDPVLAELSELGEVRSRQQSATDVTGKVIDIEARLATQRESVRRVRELLDQATDIDEIVKIESELADRQAKLESLQARYDALTDAVALSTVSLDLRATTAAPAQDGRGILGGLAAGWDAFIGFGAGALTVLATALPFLLFFGVPVAAIVWYLRRRHKTVPVERS